jgi:cell division protein FtsX
MIKNYIKIGIRNIIRQPGYSLINITGLAVGMACAIMILLWVNHELSFDRFHTDGRHIFRVVHEAGDNGRKVNIARTPIPLGPALKQEIPGVDAMSRMAITRGPLSHWNQVYQENQLHFVEPDFLNMFSFPLLKGDKDSALAQKNSIILSEATAVKYFGNKNPLGEVMTIYGTLDLTVTGIIKNIPGNSHLQFNVLMPFELLQNFGFPMENWNNSNNAIYTYIKLKSNVSQSQFQHQLSDIIHKHSPRSTSHVYMQPLFDIHFQPGLAGDIKGHGSRQNVTIFSLLAFFILLVAGINFMNLTTARSASRAREIGIRKVSGGKRPDLILQFLGESIFLSLLSLLLALVLVELLLPLFNHLADKQLDLRHFSRHSYLQILGITLLTGIFSGCYPALYLSSFQPHRVLKGSFKSGSTGSKLRKSLTVVQFAISSALIICTIIAYNQLHLIQNKNLGFDTDQLIYTRTNSTLRKNFKSYKTELQQETGILSISNASHVLTDVTHMISDVDWQGNQSNTKAEMNLLLVDPDFIPTMKMEVLKGRNFSQERTADLGKAFIINEEAVKHMGLTDPIGKTISTQPFSGPIIGVAKNFNFKPLRNEVEPMLMVASPREQYVNYIRLHPGDIPHTIGRIKKIWEKWSPDNPFQFHFMNDAIDKMYTGEKRQGDLFQYFTILALLLSSLGLFGQASYVTQQRKKEIGIRKVIGATTPGIFRMLYLEFWNWVALANLIACPIAYFPMKKWLSGFVVRTDISVWLFLGTVIATSLVALVTVAYHTITTAMANPLQAIRHE